MTNSNVCDGPNHGALKMMLARKRKELSRFRASVSFDSSFVLASNRTIFADQAAWAFAEVAAAHTRRGMLDAHLGPKKWICCILLILHELGYAERSIDEGGNLIFKSTPKLLATAGQNSGELHDRRSFFSDGQL
jgi:hypothetical protein